jgi:hypothetical protein
MLPIECPTRMGRSSSRVPSTSNQRFTARLSRGPFAAVRIAVTGKEPRKDVSARGESRNKKVMP